MIARLTSAYLGNNNEQTHLKYLGIIRYVGWGSHLAMFGRIGDCIMHLGGRENWELHHGHNHLT